MTNVGNVQVTVSLGLERLKQDAAKAQADLEKTIQDISVKVNVDPEGNVEKATTEIQGLKSAAKGDIPVGFSVDSSGKLRDAQGRFVKFKDGAEEGVEVPFKFNVGNGADISDLARNLNLTFKEARNFSSGLQLSADTANRAIGQIKNLNGVNASTVEKFRVLRKELGITKEQYLALEDAIAQTNQRLKGFDGLVQNARDFTEAVSQASLYVQALRDVQQILGQAGQQINQFSGQALAAASGFENAKAGAETLAQDIDGLTASLSELTKELDFQTNTTDLLNASTVVLGSGFDDTADATEILRASFVGAQGGLTDTETVSNAVVSALNAFNLEASEAAKIVDILAATVDAGNISFEQVANGFGEINSVAALAGLSLEEVGAAIAQATSAGQQGPAAISGVRQALINLIKPTEDSKAALKQFGIENASAIVRTEGLIGVLTRLQAAGATSDDLARIFSDVTGLATVATLAGDNLDDFREKLEFTTNSAGKASAASSIVAKTFDTQVARAFNLANESLVGLGRGVQGAVLPLVNAIVFLLENFNELPEPIKESIGVIAALSGGVLTLASAIAGIAAVIPVINAAAVSVNKLGANAKLTAGNLKAIAPQMLAIAAAGASLAIVADTFSEITEVSGETRDSIRDVEESLRELNQISASSGLDDFASSLGETDQAVQNAIDANIQAIEDRLNGLQKFLDRIRQIAEDILNNPVFRATLKFAGPVGNALDAVLPDEVDVGTAKEAAVTQQDLAFDDLISSTDEVIAKFNEFKSEGLGNQAQKDLDGLSNAINTSIAALENSAPVTESDIRNKEAQLKVFRALQTELAGYTGATEEATSAVEAQATADEEALKKLEAANAAAEAVVSQSQNAQILEVKRLQAEKAISAEEAEARITDIEKSATQQRLANVATAVAEVEQLRQSGAISEEEAIAQLMELEQQRSELNLAAIDLEIEAQERLAEAAKQAALDALDQQSSDVQTTADVQSGTIDIQSGALSSESALLTAKNDLLTAESELRQENLNKALEQAEAEGNTNQVIELRRQLTQDQQGLLAAQASIAQRQLDITQEQRRLDLEIREIAAETAVIEAELAIERAKVEGASQAEIENRTKLLDLAKRQLAAIGNERKANQELETLEDKALEANQKLEASKVSQADAKEREADAEERLKALRDEQRQTEADTQNTQNQAAVDAAQAEYDANPSARNLKAVQDARQKAIDDEFTQRQEALDAETEYAIGKAEEEAIASAEAYKAAREGLLSEEANARADGTVTEEEQRTLDVMQAQTAEAEKQAKSAKELLSEERNLARAKQQQLDTEKQAAQAAEDAKRKKETADARAAGLLSGVQGADVNTLTKARNELRALQQRTQQFGPGNQIEELLNFALRDNEFSGQAGQLNDILLNQLGGLGQAALNLEAIADSGQMGLARDLARQLDAAQVSGDQGFYQQLLTEIRELANKPVVNGLTIAAPDPLGSAGQIVRDLRAGDSKARGL